MSRALDKDIAIVIPARNEARRIGNRAARWPGSRRTGCGYSL